MRPRAKLKSQRGQGEQRAAKVSDVSPSAEVMAERVLVESSLGAPRITMQPVSRTLEPSKQRFLGQSVVEMVGGKVRYREIAAG